ncbi:MAG: coenzyme F430 synthase, partial [Methanobacteriota archaeon]
MRILILDTIHGGTVIGQALIQLGHTIDLIDVYRGDTSHHRSIDQATASRRTYDILIHPVHLDPAHPLMRTHFCPTITHHEAVRWILGEKKIQLRSINQQLIEISGTRGKTTTASALASLLPGSGILHTSRGTIRYPEGRWLSRMSITPASLIPILSYLDDEGWIIAEISLGFTGISDLAILTSDEDYSVAGGRLSATEIKVASALRCSRLLVPPGVKTSHEAQVDAGDIAMVSGTICRYSFQNMTGEFENPLFALEGYRIPLQLATAASLILGYRPDKLSQFSSLAGRMKVIHDSERVIIDNACTGACLKTTRDAIDLLRQTCSDTSYSLVIGQEERAVCENFPTPDIIEAIRTEKPDAV